MRYAKGSVQLSQAHDYPLLRQVLRSEFVLHRQLYEFLELSHYEWSRQSFAWRVRRLLRHGLLVAQHLAPFGGDLIYSVTPLVAQHLQANGESCLFSVNRPRPNPVGCLHAVELNEIHLSLLRSGVQASWTYATEVRCQNELSGFGYVKDYDAIVRLGSNGSETRFALEYERTPKAAQYYEELAKSLVQERLVRCVLYLIPSCHLLNYVSRHFARSAGRACFGLTRDWQSSPMDTPVTTPGSYARRPFLEFLRQQPL